MKLPKSIIGQSQRFTYLLGMLGDESLLLFPSPKPETNNEGGIDLGQSVSAKVLSYDPTNDDGFDLNLQIIDGPHAGETGWMLASSADGQDGVPIDLFRQSSDTQG